MSVSHFDRLLLAFITPLCKSLSQWRNNVGFLNLHHQFTLPLEEWLTAIQSRFNPVLQRYSTSYRSNLQHMKTQHDLLCKNRCTAIEIASVWDWGMFIVCLPYYAFLMNSFFMRTREETVGITDYRCRQRRRSEICKCISCPWKLPQQKTKRDGEEEQQRGKGELWCIVWRDLMIEQRWQTTYGWWRVTEGRSQWGDELQKQDLVCHADRPNVPDKIVNLAGVQLRESLVLWINSSRHHVKGVLKQTLSIWAFLDDFQCPVCCCTCSALLWTGTSCLDGRF